MELRKIIVLICIALFASLACEAKKSKKEEVEVVDIVTVESPDSMQYEIEWPDYDPWEVVTLEGKMKMRGLPVSPSVKIFMKKNSLVSISVRAPFLGEVGRLELTPEELTIINKMNKTYVKENIKGLGVIGGKILSINDVQDLLLGRFFIPGHDVTTEDLDELVDIFYEEDQFNVIPKGDAEISGVTYGFAVDAEFNPKLLVVIPENKERDIEVSAEYNRKLSGYDLTFAYGEGNKNMEVTFEFKAPEWKGEAPKSIDLDSKYRQLSIMEFMSRIG